MVNRNIKYKSKQILEFYSSNRQRWDVFFPSERWVFKRISDKIGTFGDILDVGCACGGLGRALSEKFVVSSYTGVDINKDAINWAKEKQKLGIPINLIAGDIVELELINRYDMVVSLSCADWNIETDKIIDACWERVTPGGYFVISLRLTTEKAINNIEKSYQYINFSGDEEKPEVANYVVFNFREALMMINELSPAPETIGAYGYWGTPSSTAVTPYGRLVYAVFYINKGIRDSIQSIKSEFSLPLEVFL